MRSPFLECVLIVHVRGQTARQTPAQLDLHRVVVAERTAVGDIDLVRIWIEDEEIRRVSHPGRVGAAGEVPFEVTCRPDRVRRSWERSVPPRVEFCQVVDGLAYAAGLLASVLLFKYAR